MNLIKIEGANIIDDLCGKKLNIYPSFNPTSLKGLDLKHFNTHKEKYIGILSVIYQKLATDKRYKNHSSYVSISSSTITEITNTRQRGRVLMGLENAGLIEIDHSYSTGNYSKKYRLGEKLRKSTSLEVSLVPAPVNSTKSNPDKSEVIQYLQKQLDRLSLSKESFDYCFSKYYAINDTLNTSNTSTSIYPIPYVFTFTGNVTEQNYVYAGKEPYPLRKALSDITNILYILSENSRLVTRDNTSNRAHSFLTSLRSELRGFLTVRGCEEPLVMIDLANSQLFFLSSLLKRMSIEDPSISSDDLKEFERLTSCGKFYEFGCEKTGIKDRDTFKKSFIKSYLFCKSKYMKGVFVKFMEKNFPTVHKAIIKFKEGNHRYLPINLQQIESYYIIDRIVARLKDELSESDFVATIHDCIVINSSATSKTKEIILDEFAKDDLHPSVHCKSIAKIYRSSEHSPNGVPPAQSLIVEYGGVSQPELLSKTEVLPILEQGLRKAPEQFTNAGWSFTLLKRQSNIALFEGFKALRPIRKCPNLYRLTDGSYGIYTYEIHRIRERKRYNNDRTWYISEYLAGDEDFGEYGWSAYSYERALDIYTRELSKQDSIYPAQA